MFVFEHCCPAHIALHTVLFHDHLLRVNAQFRLFAWRSQGERRGGVKLLSEIGFAWLLERGYIQSPGLMLWKVYIKLVIWKCGDLRPLALRLSRSLTDIEIKWHGTYCLPDFLLVNHVACWFRWSWVTYRPDRISRSRHFWSWIPEKGRVLETKLLGL